MPDHSYDSEPAAEAERPVQVGVVAERLGLSIRTLHHWDETGLVVPSARSAGGFRLYTEDDIARLITVRRMKPLGFTLDEMKGLLSALATLERADAEPDEQAAARGYVTDCHDRARARCDELRRTLSWAEEFRDLLAGLSYRAGAS